MSTVAPPAGSRRAESGLHGVEVSRYDQVSSTLITVLVVFGLLVLVMFMIWLSSRLVWIPPAVEIKVLEDVGGGGSGGDSFVGGGERALVEPAPEELPQVTQPQEVVDSFDSVATVVAAEALQLDTLVDTAPVGYGAGGGGGVGYGRGKGPGGPGTSDGIPAWERWEVRMAANSIDEYARQLDFFKVELAVAGGGNPNVDYISNVSAAKPTVRVGLPKDERRLRFMHRSGELRDADRQLATKAGVNTTGRVVFQFYSQDMYTRLLTLENQKMGSRRIREVLRTVFVVKGTAGRYDFEVLEQRYTTGN